MPLSFVTGTLCSTNIYLLTTKCLLQNNFDYVLIMKIEYYDVQNFGVFFFCNIIVKLLKKKNTKVSVYKQNKCVSLIYSGKLVILFT